MDNYAEPLLRAMQDHAISVLQDNKTSLREELTSGHVTRCHLCNDVGLSIHATEITLSGEVHTVKCIDCGSSFIVNVYRVEASNEHTARRTRKHLITQNHSDCDIQLVFHLSPETLEASTEYVTPEVTELSERIEEHHVSYEPEITLPLCKSCHDKIHANSEYAGLQPELTREEWESH